MSANQSRRRTDAGAGPDIGNQAKADNTSPYKGNELDDNSLRLVEIQPAVHDSDPVVCTLSQVPFGSRPKYEALSYTWGSCTSIADDATIKLNGSPFEVRQNLFDALVFLRRHTTTAPATGRRFWIDAICIDQKNVKERNQQVGIMDQIYFRASAVIVWLGSWYSKFQLGPVVEFELLPLKGNKTAEDVDRDTLPDNVASNTEQSMVQHLRTDPYWERLWILQEIGRARTLRVCFGNYSYTWVHFIRLVTLHHSDGTRGPLRLDRLLRQEQYRGSHTLKRLLEEHRDAKCSDPRDKVYGLIGLATDATTFHIHMDYSKSLYDVWKDTMVFMNKMSLFTNESQVVPTGELIKYLLRADESDPLRQIQNAASATMQMQGDASVHTNQVIDNTKSPLAFRLRAAVLGRIVCAGPSTDDIVAKLNVAKGWRAAIQSLYPADVLGQRHCESDHLVRALLEADGSAVETMCFNRPSNVVWGCNDYKLHEYLRKPKGRTLSFGVQPPSPQQEKDRLAPVLPRMYMLESRPRDALCRMGVASSLLQVDDLICSIQSSKRALLVRRYDMDNGSTKFRAYGTSMSTDEICSSQVDYATQQWKALENDIQIDLYLDVDTLFLLLE